MQRKHKTYIIRPNHFSRNPAVEVHPGQSYDVTPASYNRLTRLANSGQYNVQILDADYGIAWQLQRKRPIAPDAQDYYNEADYDEALDDWKEYVDYGALEAEADYYDHIASGKPSDELPY